MARQRPAGDVVVSADDGTDKDITASVVRYGRFVEIRIMRAGRYLLASAQLPRSEASQLGHGLIDLTQTMTPEA